MRAIAGADHHRTFEDLPAVIDADWQVMQALSPVQRVALTAWAEARARFEDGRWQRNPQQAMADIVNVIDNRARDPRWRRLGHAGVCYYPFAFSCWWPNGGRRNFDALIGTARILLAGDDVGPVLGDCLALAAIAVDGRFEDSLQLATHYHALWIPAPSWARPPAVMTAERYGHRFFAHVK
jgi:hypothetical protein